MDKWYPTVSKASNPRFVRLLAPRIPPIITDGTVSMVLTEDHRTNPYIISNGTETTIASIILTDVAHLALRYVTGIGLDPEQMWLNVPLRNGLRSMAAGWVLFFDCNPDMMLARTVSEQNEYLATRDQLGLPQLRWAADLKHMALRESRAL